MDWTRDFDEARTLSDEAASLLAERNQALVERQDGSVSRLSAALRRKLTALNAKAAALESGVLSGEVSDREAERRRGALLRLRSQIAQLSTELNKKATSSLGLAEKPRETAETAERDEHGLLVLQRSLMSEQDDQLEDLSRTLVGTKHIALAVHDELDLQARLLDDVEDDVESTTGHIAQAQAKLKQLLRSQGECRLMLCLVVVIIALVAVILVSLKVTKVLG